MGRFNDFIKDYKEICKKYNMIVAPFHGEIWIEDVEETENTFLEEYKGGDFLGFIDKDIIILFINKNNKIINYVINNNSKEFIQTEMEFAEFKKLILNEDFKQFDKTLSFSRNFLYKYEIDLMNDVNDWLNGQISEKKYYKLLFTS